MLIGVPVGMKYVGRAWGSVIKKVTCVYCHAEFVYELRRSVLKATSAPGFIAMGSAKQRSLAGAQKLLAKTLERDHDLIPCPHCGRLQPQMNRKLRWKWTGYLLACWCFALIVAFFGVEAADMNHHAVRLWVYLLAGGSTALAAMALVWIHLHEFTAAATDRAQIKAEAEAEHFARLYLPRMLEGQWLWTRGSLFTPPTCCARCGSPEADRTLHRLVMGAQRAPTRLELRVCRSCRAKVRWIRFVWASAIWLASVAITILLLWWVWDFDLASASVLGVITGGLLGFVPLGIAKFVILDRLGFPLRVRNYRFREDSLELRFENPAVAEEYLANAITRMQQITAAPQAIESG